MRRPKSNRSRRQLRRLISGAQVSLSAQRVKGKKGSSSDEMGSDSIVASTSSMQHSSDTAIWLKEPLQELADWTDKFLAWFRPTSRKSVSQVLEQDMVKIKNMVQGLKRYADSAEARALQAEANVEALMQERQQLAAELNKARKELALMARYAEDIEDERDEAKAKFEALQKQRTSQSAELQRLSTQLATLAASVDGGAVSTGQGSETASAIQDAEVVGIELPNPGTMTIEDLRAECVVRGLPSDGPLASVRGRIRAARARDKVHGVGS